MNWIPHTLHYQYNPLSTNSRSKANFFFQFIASYVWYSMEKLAGDLLSGLKLVKPSILQTVFIHFVYHRLGELRSRYWGIKWRGTICREGEIQESKIHRGPHGFIVHVYDYIKYHKTSFCEFCVPTMMNSKRSVSVLNSNFTFLGKLQSFLSPDQYSTMPALSVDTTTS